MVEIVVQEASAIFWSTIVSAVATVGLVASTVCFHRWTRQQRRPKPQVIGGDVVWQKAEKDRWNFILLAANTGEVPIFIEHIAVVVDAKGKTVWFPACGFHIKRSKAAMAEDMKAIPGRGAAFVDLYVDGLTKKGWSRDKVRFTMWYTSGFRTKADLSKRFSLLRARTERTYTLVLSTAMQKASRNL